MIFKGLRISAKYGKAHGMILNENYAEAYKLLINIIELKPEEWMLPMVYSDLGIAEYHFGNYKECYDHMDYCIKDSVKNSDLWSGKEQLDLLELVSWYFNESEKQI